MMLVCARGKRRGMELGCLALVVNDKNRAGYGSALLCGEETWILAWARARAD
jgi:hypothetical protein